MDFLVFLKQTNSRTEYIFSHILNNVLGLNVVFTSDSDFFMLQLIFKVKTLFVQICGSSPAQTGNEYGARNSLGE